MKCKEELMEELTYNTKEVMAMLKCSQATL
jgi:hypothetical protein